MMWNYGAGPNPNEIEVTLFGPGYGEAIAIHLGDAVWLLIDSCINKETQRPASLEYLTSIGVPLESVCMVIASHWHDDHVKGLTSIVEQCKNAELVISGIFTEMEALNFLCTYSGISAPSQTRGTKELYNALKFKPDPTFTALKHTIFERKLAQRNIRISAFSPTNLAQRQSKLLMSAHLPKAANEPIKHAPDLTPNDASVVVHIDLGDDAILLGSDLENSAAGWSVIVADPWCAGLRSATLYKVAHHGSISGDHEHIWTKLLTNNPAVALTPFKNGSVNLPTPADVLRIKSVTANIATSSASSKKPLMDSHLRKRLGDICKTVTPANAGLGAIRFRTTGGGTWTRELFGAAQAL